ncbi:hypothetical protein [Ramlibacter sp. PS4R-6]|uniref:hypothetical protein n=1 Tax=Ramlibacter sp. PS4R-6 TaxID=3133438 RepID=UPI0030A396F3
MLEAIVLALSIVVPPEAETVVNAAIADVSRRFAMKARVVSVERVTWRDGSLGCPQPGMNYTQALVPGWRIELAVGSRSFLYHASERGRVVNCPPGRAKKPLPDSRT